MIFSLGILEKYDGEECILILVIHWKKAGLLHIMLQDSKLFTKEVMPDLMIWKQISLSHDKDVI
jgi:hypothetical protein